MRAAAPPFVDLVGWGPRPDEAAFRAAIWEASRRDIAKLLSKMLPAAASAGSSTSPGGPAALRPARHLHDANIHNILLSPVKYRDATIKIDIIAALPFCAVIEISRRLPRSVIDASSVRLYSSVQRKALRAALQASPAGAGRLHGRAVLFARHIVYFPCNR